MKICTHYGFGDYVICYGLIRELAKKDDITLYDELIKTEDFRAIHLINQDL